MRSKCCLALILITAILLCAAANGQSLTFEARGHMVEAYASDFAVGDSFVADFTFDPNAPPNSNAPDETQYLSITSWTFRFDRGYVFEASADSINPQVGWFDIINDYTNVAQGYSVPTDRYTVTLAPINSVGQSLPSGSLLNLLQFDLIDDLPTGSPDLLTSEANPTVPPSLTFATNNTGRVDYVGPGVSPQPHLTLDSITVVPEPETSVLALIGAFATAITVRRNPQD